MLKDTEGNNKEQQEVKQIKESSKKLNALFVEQKKVKK